MRAWADLDGIKTPENVKGFYVPFYTFRDLWRSWNVSVHLWVMRYIYQPLGGTRSQLWSVWIIFLFVGVWHDLQIKWIAWVIFNCGCFCGEIVFIYMFSSERFESIRAWKYYEWLASFVGAIDLIFMMSSNAVAINGFYNTYVAAYQFFNPAIVLVIPGILITFTFGVRVLRIEKTIK
jgi:D-alanyl-lipoteichoic acid acyltransferase DltB (MBOAT superfamily)